MPEQKLMDSHRVTEVRVSAIIDMMKILKRNDYWFEVLERNGRYDSHDDMAYRYREKSLYRFHSEEGEFKITFQPVLGSGLPGGEKTVPVEYRARYTAPNDKNGEHGTATYLNISLIKREDLGIENIEMAVRHIEDAYEEFLYLIRKLG